MKTSDKITLIYLIICILVAGFFAILGYGLNGTGADMPKAVIHFCFYVILLLSPYAIVFLTIETIKRFKIWKLINLILILCFWFICYMKF